MSLFSVWNTQGIRNQYKSLPIKEPVPIEPIEGDGERESSHKERSSKAWEKALEDRKKVNQNSRAMSKNVRHQKMDRLIVEDVMQFPVRSLKGSDFWQSAWDLVTKNDISHIPILSDEKKLVGIISEKDLLRVKLNSKNMLSIEFNPPISSFMKSNVISALPSTSIRRVASVMFQEHIGAMPIVNDYSLIIGIVTMKDILKNLVMHSPIKMWSYD